MTRRQTKRKGIDGRRRPAGAVVFLSLFLFLGSCGDDGTLGPHPVDDDVPAEHEGSGTVGSAGGTVSVSSSDSPVAGASVRIPSGALAEPTVIEVRPGPAGDPDDGLRGTIVEMLPAGTQFAEPVEITIPYDPSLPRTPTKVFYLDETGVADEDEPVWRELPTRPDPSGNRLIAETTHFTKFAAGEDDIEVEAELFRRDGRIAGSFTVRTPLIEIPTGSSPFHVIASSGRPNLRAVMEFQPRQFFVWYQVELHRKRLIGSTLEATDWIYYRINSLDPNRSTGSVAAIGRDGYQERFGETMTFDLAEAIYTGEVILFTFPDFEPDPGHEYYLRVLVRWVNSMTPPVLAHNNMRTPISISTRSDARTWAQMSEAPDQDRDRWNDRTRPEIVTTELPAGTVGESYSYGLQVSRGLPPFRWELPPVHLPSRVTPPGLTLSEDGRLSGTPTEPGSYTFRVRVEGSNGWGVTRDVSLEVLPPAAPPSITTSSLPEGTVGQSYSATLQAGGGRTPYSWSIAAGSLPSGLSLSSGGTISGTPTSLGTTSFTVRVTGADGLSSTRSLSIQVSAAPQAPTITTSSLPGGTVGQSYSATLQASGGTTPYSWSIASGSLPSGLSLSSSGTISGTPTSPGTATFTVRVTGNDGRSRTRSLGIDVLVASEPPQLASVLPEGVVGDWYEGRVDATGGSYPYTWAITAGSLPPGLSSYPGESVDQPGVYLFSGTPTASGTWSFTLRVTDDEGLSASGQFTITVSGEPTDPLEITTTSLPAGTVGTSYSATLEATGGTTPYSWSVASGSLPSGLSLSSGGTISGTPGSSGSASFTVRVTDGGGRSSNRAMTIEIDGNPSIPGTFFGGGTSMGLFTHASVDYYLIVAPEDAPDLIAWGSEGTLRGALDREDGLKNVEILLPFGADPVTGHPAVHWCASLSTNGYADWYLPAPGELQEMLNRYSLIDGFPNSVDSDFQNPANWYWSSQESPTDARPGTFASTLGIIGGFYAVGSLPKAELSQVRCVRRVMPDQLQSP